jgi:large subunit ribosomal protein L9e
MRLLAASRTVAIPEGVTVEVKGRKARVVGPRGTLTRDLSHLALDMYITKDEDGQSILKVDCHSGKKIKLAQIRTACSHVQNMITGVTLGFKTMMRLVYAHFPININVTKGGECVEIRNFLGEKRVRVVNMLAGCKIERSEAVKDELVISGNDIELVNRSAAMVHDICLTKNKDLRKFLDGIYVSGKGTVVTVDA